MIYEVPAATVIISHKPWRLTTRGTYFLTSLQAQRSEIRVSQSWFLLGSEEKSFLTHLLLLVAVLILGVLLFIVKSP